jgi:uncharacterized YccA/Bax inhibitor family protein
MGVGGYLNLFFSIFIVTEACFGLLIEYKLKRKIKKKSAKQICRMFNNG